MGDGGIIRINTDSLSLTNGAQLFASTRGQGNAGNIFLNARDRISFDGESGNGSLFSGAFSRVDATGLGEGGNIDINAGSLFLTNGGQLGVSTFGQGNAGNVTVFARDTIALSGTSSSGTLVSSIASTVERTGVGAGGNIRINTRSLSITNGASLIASTRNQGNAGNVTVFVRDTIALSGTNRSETLVSSIASTVERTGVGAGGNIHISTGSLSLMDGSALTASTSGQGDAGNISINARDRISLDRTNSFERLPNGIFSSVARFGVGAGGDIYIHTNSLSVANGSVLVSGTFGQGDAGNIIVNARERISFDGRRSNGRFATGASSRVEKTGIGSGGNLYFNTRVLSLANGALLVAGTGGQGNAGNIFVNARDRISLDGSSRNGRIPTGAFSSVGETGVGAGGTMRFNTGLFSLTNGAQLSASTFGRGNSGDIIINAHDGVSVDGVLRNGRFESAAFSRVSASGRGQGGDIRITTERLSISDRGGLVSSSDGQGNAGNIRIAARAVRLDRGRIDATNASRNGGNIVLRDLALLLLRRSSRISTEAGTANRGGGGNGGNIAIAANLIFAVPSENSDINANAFDGQGGNIDITTQGIFGIEPRLVASPLTSDITASSALGVNGVIDITTPDVDPRRGLTQLPATVADAANQIVQTCPTRGNAAERLSEFVVTGRGGIPPNPADMLNGATIVSHLSSLDEFSVDQDTRRGTDETSASTAHTPVMPDSTATPNTPDVIREAQGWVVNQAGDITLVIDSPAIAPHSLAVANDPCGGHS